MDQIGELSLNGVFRRFLRRRICGASSSSRWEQQAGEEGAMSGEAGYHQDQEASDPHRLYSGAAADAGAQLPQVPLPVSAGAAQHRLGPAPLRDSGEDLVPEQAHQVEKGAPFAGKGGRGGAELFHITLVIAHSCLLPSDLQPPLLSAAHDAPAGGALSSLRNA